MAAVVALPPRSLWPRRIGEGHLALERSSLMRLVFYFSISTCSVIISGIELKIDCDVFVVFCPQELVGLVLLPM